MYIMYVEKIFDNNLAVIERLSPLFTLSALQRFLYIGVPQDMKQYFSGFFMEGRVRKH
jgi:hypothetical protein